MAFDARYDRNVKDIPPKRKDAKAEKADKGKNQIDNKVSKKDEQKVDKENKDKMVSVKKENSSIKKGMSKVGKDKIDDKEAKGNKRGITPKMGKGKK